MRAALSAFFAAALLASCGGNNETAILSDPILERQANAGRAALALEQPAQAVKQYREALVRARQRDDPAVIADLAFNLAVAQLQARQAEAALKTVQEAAAELQRRGTVPPAALRLAGAIALYRIGRRAEADAAAVAVEPNSDPEVAARAAFLRGLIADANGDTVGLQAARDKIAATKGFEARADEAELSARLALHNRDPSHTRVEAERAATLRRNLLDYVGVSRCLALAALAAERSDDAPAAADFYLRAARGAAGQGDNALARNWLDRALSLSRDPALSEAASAALALLKVER